MIISRKSIENCNWRSVKITKNNNPIYPNIISPFEKTNIKKYFIFTIHAKIECGNLSNLLLKNNKGLNFAIIDCKKVVGYMIGRMYVDARRFY